MPKGKQVGHQRTGLLTQVAYDSPYKKITPEIRERLHQETTGEGGKRNAKMTGLGAILGGTESTIRAGFRGVKDGLSRNVSRNRMIRSGVGGAALGAAAGLAGSAYINRRTRKRIDRAHSYRDIGEGGTKNISKKVLEYNNRFMEEYGRRPHFRKSLQLKRWKKNRGDVAKTASTSLMRLTKQKTLADKAKDFVRKGKDIIKAHPKATAAATIGAIGVGVAGKKIKDNMQKQSSMAGTLKKEVVLKPNKKGTFKVDKSLGQKAKSFVQKGYNAARGAARKHPVGAAAVGATALVGAGGIAANKLRSEAKEASRMLNRIKRELNPTLVDKAKSFVRGGAKAVKQVAEKHPIGTGFAAGAAGGIAVNKLNKNADYSFSNINDHVLAKGDPMEVTPERRDALRKAHKRSRILDYGVTPLAAIPGGYLGSRIGAMASIHPQSMRRGGITGAALGAGALGLYTYLERKRMGKQIDNASTVSAMGRGLSTQGALKKVQRSEKDLSKARMGNLIFKEAGLSKQADSMQELWNDATPNPFRTAIANGLAAGLVPLAMGSPTIGALLGGHVGYRQYKDLENLRDTNIEELEDNDLRNKIIQLALSKGIGGAMSGGLAGGALGMMGPGRSKVLVLAGAGLGALSGALQGGNLIRRFNNLRNAGDESEIVE